MFQIVNGTKENVVADVVDRTAAVTDLSALSPKFWVEKADGTAVVSNVTASATAMRVQCLIDTVGTVYADGVHNLYIGFTVGTEVPKIFAGQFHVI